jgi:putative transposase
MNSSHSDHVHALIWFSRPECLSRFMHEWKRYSSRQIRPWYRQQVMNYFEQADFGDRFWQSKYHAFEVFSRPKPEEKLEYMHLNPVRAGLMKRGVCWPWSSARWYLERKSMGINIEWVE